MDSYSSNIHIPGVVFGNMGWGNMGWECPKCARCFAPSITECPYCQPQPYWTVTYPVGTTYTYPIDLGVQTITFDGE